MSDQNLSVLLSWRNFGSPWYTLYLYQYQKIIVYDKCRLFIAFSKINLPKLIEPSLRVLSTRHDVSVSIFFPFPHPWLSKICNKSADAFLQQTQCARYRFVWMCVWKLFKLKNYELKKKEKILCCFIEKNIHLKLVLLNTCTMVYREWGVKGGEKIKHERERER